MAIEWIVRPRTVQSLKTVDATYSAVDILCGGSDETPPVVCVVRTESVVEEWDELYLRP